MDFNTSVPVLLLLLLGSSKAHDDNDHGAVHDLSMEQSAKEDFTATILRMNNASSDFLLEGDVIIPQTRNAMKCLGEPYSCLWPKSANGYVEIPFILSEKYDNSEKTQIVAAMRGFHSRTCIRFIPRATQRAYLSVEARYGCASLLGYTGDKQRLSLQRYGCINNGIIQHELMHTLGFYHEHTRSDRDQYIRINWDNINQYFVYNFRKMDTDNLNTPYDYSSVMHYGRTAFGTQGKETITPTYDPSATIGQREGLSNIDIYRLNKLYRCWGFTG